MRIDSKKNWNNPYSEFYTTSLKKLLEQYFEQHNVPQELSVEDKLSLLLESTELCIERTHQGFQIQASNCGNNFNDQEETVSGTEEHSASHSRPREEATYIDVFPEPRATHAYVPLKPFPQRLHECTKIDVLEAIHTKSAFGTSQVSFWTH
ncbi:hypothetical protein D8674_030778 [Pyrus ussuriensis x Pyrus communis]|uniref:Uncharacterized protein n=1 Tax=Pyrus ussuriensis x Pyrus communis TaxID=2448454 RepID=A0A5N5EWJ9_9ROSA|nr:hypothetical protein D8674_030778 [Pyrus ussuriensis x Pyrus communis]